VSFAAITRVASVIGVYFVIDSVRKLLDTSSYVCTYVQRCTQKFPDWPPGARTANGTILCH
jgi:hypothetical protein